MEGIQHRRDCPPPHSIDNIQVVWSRRDGDYVTKRFRCRDCGRGAVIKRFEPEETPDER